jgi:hypothetical protein
MEGDASGILAAATRLRRCFYATAGGSIESPSHRVSSRKSTGRRIWQPPVFSWFKELV